MTILEQSVIDVSRRFIECTDHAIRHGRRERVMRLLKAHQEFLLYHKNLPWQDRAQTRPYYEEES